MMSVGPRNPGMAGKMSKFHKACSSYRSNSEMSPIANYICSRSGPKFNFFPMETTVIKRHKK